MRFIPLSVLLLVTTIIITIVLLTLQCLYKFIDESNVEFVSRMLTRGFNSSKHFTIFKMLHLNVWFHALSETASSFIYQIRGHVREYRH